LRRRGVAQLHHCELHRRGNERAWWQTQGIDPLPIATSLWEKTHVVVGGDKDRLPQLNGRHFGDGAAAGVDRRQIDETKPIHGPEAE
jgi:hypothetical protein